MNCKVFFAPLFQNRLVSNHSVLRLPSQFEQLAAEFRGKTVTGLRERIQMRSDLRYDPPLLGDQQNSTRTENMDTLASSSDSTAVFINHQWHPSLPGQRYRCRFTAIHGDLQICGNIVNGNYLQPALRPSRGKHF